MHMLSTEEQANSIRGFSQFLSWTTPIIFIFAGIYTLVFLIFKDNLIGGTGAIILGFGCVAWAARQELKRGHIVRAVTLFSAAQLVAAICVTLLQPSLLPSLILVPLLAVAVALPYMKGRAIISLIIGCWAVLAIITVLGLFVNLLGSEVSPYNDILLIGMISATAGLILLLLWQFSSRLNASLDATQVARAALASSYQALAEKNSQLETKIDEQEKLLELVTTLEVPVIDLSNGILLAPIVGHMDSRRTSALTNRLLNDASQRQAQLVIIDVAGVPLMDTMVVQLLVEMTSALRLLGCQIALCGISAQVAMTLTTLGISLSDVTTVRGPQEAIAWYEQATAKDNQALRRFTPGNN